ncbi:MAG: 1-aminocyclopropane-1-carboxylate deaminase/D-cysteine desulfhydrase [Flavobacteriales bacterium]
MKTKVPIQSIDNVDYEKKEIKLFVQREDLNHPVIQGNKLRKLHYNILNAKQKGNKTILTFGGAYSNHILAVAQAGKEFGFKTIGIIRGEEILPLNSTLSQCKQLGMQIQYMNRTVYKLKHTQDVVDSLRNTYGAFYLIPEGGSNYYAVNGCMEIIKNFNEYDYICCPVGTGGTIAGITIANQNKCNIIGFPALKGGEFLIKDISDLINLVVNDRDLTQDLMKSVNLITKYHFGGYAKINEELINFVREFNENHHIKWDLIYNGKMAFAINKMIQEDYFPIGSRILMIHTGGLQGINGLEERHKIKIYD